MAARAAPAFRFDTGERYYVNPTPVSPFVRSACAVPQNDVGDLVIDPLIPRSFFSNGRRTAIGAL